MKGNEFKKYHPIVNFIYFAFVIGFACFFMHPVCLLLSFSGAIAYSIMLNGKDAVKNSLKFILPMLIIMALINPLFNHKGVTVLAYFKSGNPLTLESVIYGILTAVMIASVICWFSCYNKIMTSDKFIYLLGRIMPAMALVISMTLRFVPRFTTQMKVVSKAQRTLGRDASEGGILKRAKSGLNILSIMTTWSLENAVETADSMKARGYGLPGRTSFSIFTFEKRDKTALIILLFLGAYVLVGSALGSMSFQCFPRILMEITPFGVSVFIAYLVLLIYPLIIEIWEVRKWKALK